MNPEPRSAQEPTEEELSSVLEVRERRMETSRKETSRQLSLTLAGMALGGAAVFLAFPSNRAAVQQVLSGKPVPAAASPARARTEPAEKPMMDGEDLQLAKDVMDFMRLPKPAEAGKGEKPPAAPAPAVPPGAAGHP